MYRSTKFVDLQQVISLLLITCLSWQPLAYAKLSSVSQSLPEQELLSAAQLGDVAKVRSLLFSNKKLAKVKDMEGNTPLHLAARSGSVETAQTLLEFDADAKAKSKADVTPLHYAAQSGQVEIVNLLVGRKVNFDAKDKSGRRPSDYATAGGNADLAFGLKKKEEAQARQRQIRNTLIIIGISVAAAIIIYKALNKDKDDEAKSQEERDKAAKEAATKKAEIDKEEARKKELEREANGLTNEIESPVNVTSTPRAAARPTPTPAPPTPQLPTTQGSPIAGNSAARRKIEICGTYATGPSGFDLTGDVGTFWEPGSTLNVHFVDGDMVTMEKVARIADEWTQYANIRFRWFFGLANRPNPAHITITFQVPDGIYHSAVGKASMQKRPSMSLGIRNDSAVSIRSTVLHEFGHALGLKHEHQNPRAGIKWNKEAVYRDMLETSPGWRCNDQGRECSDERGREIVAYNVFRQLTSNSIRSSNFDPKSIMCYAFPAEWTTDSFFVPWNTDLSATDREWIRKFYPVSTAATPPAAPSVLPSPPVYYISELGVTSWTPNGGVSSTPESSNSSKWIKIDRDLNTSVGGNTIYLWYKRTTDPNQAIRNLKVLEGQNPKIPEGYLWSDADLNKGAKGAYLYFIWTKNTNEGAPIKEIGFSFVDSEAAGYDKAGFARVLPELNKGAGGKTIITHIRR